MPDRHIDISIEFKRRQLDLRVPTAVSLGRLTELVATVLREQGIVMPERWRLALKDTPITVGDHDVRADVPLGDGDVFEVVVRSNDAEHATVG